MSEEFEGARTVDGITEDGLNSFVSERYGIALQVKPDLTDGDLFRWGRSIEIDDQKTSDFTRRMVFRAAVKAGIIKYRTDRGDVDNVKAEHGAWYGLKLYAVYLRYTAIDPN